MGSAVFVSEIVFWDGLHLNGQGVKGFSPIGPMVWDTLHWIVSYSMHLPHAQSQTSSQEIPHHSIEPASQSEAVFRESEPTIANS